MEVVKSVGGSDFCSVPFLSDFSVIFAHRIEPHTRGEGEEEKREARQKQGRGVDRANGSGI